MKDIKELQNLWQKQKCNLSEKFDIGQIVKKLESFTQKQFRINIAKTIGVATIIILFAWQILSRETVSFIIYFGTGWISLSVFIIMIVYWKKQFKISDLNFNIPETEFLKKTLNKLSSQKKIMRYILLFITISLIIGINIIYFELFKQYDLNTRLLCHSLNTLLLIAMSFAGLKIRDRKFNKEYQPLINDLKNSLNELEIIAGEK